MSLPVQSSHILGSCSCHRHSVHPIRLTTVRSSILPRTNSRRVLSTAEALSDERNSETSRPIAIFDPLRILLSRKRSSVKAACSGTNNGAVIEDTTASSLEFQAPESTEQTSSQASARLPLILEPVPSPKRSSMDGGKSMDSYDGVAPDDFCIIENQVKDFENLPLEEIGNNMMFRKTRIFLLLEEVRRLRIQMRLKGGVVAARNDLIEQEQKYMSALPFMPPLNEKTLQQYYTLYALFFLSVTLFGALVAPIAELKLGLGGTSYQDFVTTLHLPAELANVDPIVASFCGGAVGVVSCLLVIEVGNVTRQQKNRCHYCEGTGYLTCGQCVGSGLDSKTSSGCSYCSSTGKVMCTGCLCTGKQLATEYDPRRDPFE